MYCSCDDRRPTIQMPFRQDGKICATDGHMLIRISESLCEGEYYDTVNGQTPPSTGKVIPAPTICESLTMQMLTDALAKAPEEQNRKCPECDGSGCVPWQYHDRNDHAHTKQDDCPECNGTGELDDYIAFKYQFTIHGAALCYTHLKTLQRTMTLLGIDTIRLRYVEPLKPILFHADGDNIEIVAMSQMRDDELEEVKIM